MNKPLSETLDKTKTIEHVKSVAELYGGDVVLQTIIRKMESGALDSPHDRNCGCMNCNNTMWDVDAAEITEQSGTLDTSDHLQMIDLYAVLSAIEEELTDDTSERAQQINKIIQEALSNTGVTNTGADRVITNKLFQNGRIIKATVHHAKEHGHKIDSELFTDAEPTVDRVREEEDLICPRCGSFADQEIGGIYCSNDDCSWGIDSIVRKEETKDD